MHACGFEKVANMLKTCFLLIHRIWTSASTPWQFLATCFDIKNALDSGHPESYMSHLPVHQDGTCNGLQHYAALGRDAEGGSAVNLTPTDKPQVGIQHQPALDQFHIASNVPMF